MNPAEWLSGWLTGWRGLLTATLVSIALLGVAALVLSRNLGRARGLKRFRASVLEIAAAALTKGPQGALTSAGKEAVTLWREAVGSGPESIFAALITESDDIVRRGFRDRRKNASFAIDRMAAAEAFWKARASTVLLSADEISEANFEGEACSLLFERKLREAADCFDSDTGSQLATTLWTILSPLYPTLIARPAAQPAILALMGRANLEQIKEIRAELWRDRLEGENSEISGVFGVPLLTREMLQRDIVSAIAVELASTTPRTSPYLSLIGPGGAGKSAIAAMLAHSASLRSEFPDGIFWISLGQAPILADRHAVWLTFITNRPLSYPSVEASAAFLASHFKARRALLIIDDVWELSDLKAFQVGGPRCRTLLTTRENKIASAVGGVRIPIGRLSPDESRKLLQIRSGDLGEAPEHFDAIAQIVEHLPLALELAAHQLRSGMPASELLGALGAELNNLKSLDIPGFEHEEDFEVSRNLSLDACLNLTLRRMPSDLMRRLATLAILKPGSSFGSSVVGRVWGTAEVAAGESLRRLWAMSLIEEAAIETDGEVRNYRMHSVVRAKGLEVLNELGAGPSDNAQVEAIRVFLRRCNSSHPRDWHLVKDDGHTLDHLIYYLEKALESEAMLQLLSGRDPGVGYSPNHWHGLRIERSQEDIFAIDVRSMFEYFVRTSSGLPTIAGLLRSYLAVASVAEMHRDIDESLALALLRSGLWSEGLVASHAKRRFSPGGIAFVARHLTEPLRTATLREGIAMASGMLPTADTAFGLIGFASAFDGEQRQQILAAAIKVVSFGLAPERTWSKNGKIAAQRLPYLRAALVLAGDAERVSSSLCDLSEWVDRFLNTMEAADLVLGSDGIAFGDRGAATYDETVSLLETLIFLGRNFDSVVAGRASALASRILTEILGSRVAYAPLRFKLLDARNDDSVAIRGAAVSALCQAQGDLYGAIELRPALGPSEGVQGLATALIERFGDDHDFISEIATAKQPNRCRSVFFAALISSHAARTTNAILANLLRPVADGIVYCMIENGSLAPPGRLPMRLRDEHFRIARALVASGIVDRYSTASTLLEGLGRVSSDTDRLKMFEILLPSLGQLDSRLAKNFCATFRHLESASIAWLAAGTLVKTSDQAPFLEAAIGGFFEGEDSSGALRALSKYVGGYAASDAVRLARSAAALAAGIGDADAMRTVYCRASVSVPRQTRQSCIKAPIWDWFDTMPTHAEISPVPRSHSLVREPFWTDVDPDEPMAADWPDHVSTISNQAFVSLVIATLSDIPPNQTRSSLANQVADMAQEFSLRDMDEHSTAFAQAIFDTAVMYR